MCYLSSVSDRLQSPAALLLGPDMSGIGIGLSAALISIMTVWLSDLKMGYCTTGWWLSQKFCCLEVSDEGEGCAEWRNWGGMEPFQYIFYVLFAVSAYFRASAYGRLRSWLSGSLLLLCRLSGSGIRTVRRWIRNLRDQVHSGRIHHQGISGRRDVLPERLDSGERDDVRHLGKSPDISASCHWVRSLGRKRGSVSPPRLQFWQCRRQDV